MPPITRYFDPFESSYLESIYRVEYFTTYGNRFLQLAAEGQQELETTKYATMSSLARRACYKCGTVGHFAGL